MWYLSAKSTYALLEYKLQKMLTNPSNIEPEAIAACGTGHMDNRIQQNIQGDAPSGSGALRHRNCKCASVWLNYLRHHLSNLIVCFQLEDEVNIPHVACSKHSKFGDQWFHRRTNFYRSEKPSLLPQFSLQSCHQLLQERIRWHQAAAELGRLVHQ